ncbi:hypothetical protein like AT4G29090 [Hibiscus trionum]|uniref:RNase H type-1 domain-containing protein n=1 Tax=Hibiscus trionum TaxID=183268 RepID=A0A9W7M2P2_HIBTR|nr:hypothetical protein like AT4G29090 [Hibiscus trionum]
MQFSGTIRTIWLVLVGAAIWSLWLARNEKAFKEKDTNPIDLLFYKKLRTLFWFKATKEDFLPSIDEWWENPGCILDSHANNKVVDFCWSPPRTGFIKFNVDGAVKNEAAGCGGVLRTHEGVMRAVFAGPVDCCGVDYAELSTIKIGLQVFTEMEWSGSESLIVESDSKIVLNWINDVSQRPWRWWSVLLEIDSLVREIGVVIFTHVGRQSNTMADALAKDGIRRLQLFKAWW